MLFLLRQKLKKDNYSGERLTSAFVVKCVMLLHERSLLAGCSNITPIASDRCGVINTSATSSPNWVSGDDTKFGYDSESVALLCSAALV